MLSTSHCILRKTLAFQLLKKLKCLLLLPALCLVYRYTLYRHALFGKNSAYRCTERFFILWLFVFNFVVINSVVPRMRWCDQRSGTKKISFFKPLGGGRGDERALPLRSLSPVRYLRYSHACQICNIWLTTVPTTPWHAPSRHCRDARSMVVKFRHTFSWVHLLFDHWKNALLLCVTLPVQNGFCRVSQYETNACPPTALTLKLIIREPCSPSLLPRTGNPSPGNSWLYPDSVT